MKKMSMWSIALVLFCTFFQIGTYAQSGGGAGTGGGVDDPPPLPPPSIVSSNWINDMNSHNCVVLQADNQTIKVFVVVTVGVPDVEGNFPPLHFSADFGGNLYSDGPVLDTDLQPVEIKGVGTAFQAQYAFDFQFNADCPYDGQGDYPFDMDFSITLTLADGTDYPISSYPLLFPQGFLGNDEFGNPIPLVATYSGTKGVCCFDQTGGQPRSAELEETTLALSVVQPNPFNDHLLVNYELAAPALVNVQLVDLNGRVVSEKNSQETQSGVYQAHLNTATLPPGFYFCTVKTGTETKMVKVLKTE